jgi:hypothetical protein
VTKAPLFKAGMLMRFHAFRFLCAVLFLEQVVPRLGIKFCTVVLSDEEWGERVGGLIGNA